MSNISEAAKKNMNQVNGAKRAAPVVQGDNKSRSSGASTRYVVYTVGGWYRRSAYNEQVMFASDADKLTLKAAQNVVTKLGLRSSDIEEAARV